MKKRAIGLNILLSLIPAFLLFINLPDLIQVLRDDSGYPLGSEFFSAYSIYKSKGRYVGFLGISIFLSIIALVLIWKQKWRWLLVVFLLSILFFFYPILTMEN